jgi:hypothetical protein
MPSGHLGDRLLRGHYLRHPVVHEGPETGESGAQPSAMELVVGRVQVPTFCFFLLPNHDISHSLSALPVP